MESHRTNFPFPISRFPRPLRLYKTGCFEGVRNGHRWVTKTPPPQSGEAVWLWRIVFGRFQPTVRRLYTIQKSNFLNNKQENWILCEFKVISGPMFGDGVWIRFGWSLATKLKKLNLSILKFGFPNGWNFDSKISPRRLFSLQFGHVENALLY